MAKQTFAHTCGAGPALGMFEGRVIVAWPGGGGLGGQQPNYQLNLAFVDPDSHSNELAKPPVVLDERSVYRPSVVEFEQRLYVAWTGTDPAGRLNVLSMLTLTDFPVKRTFDETAIGGPCLFAYQGSLWVAWSGGGGLGRGAPNTRINIAKVHVTDTDIHLERVAVLDQTSRHSPAFAQFTAEVPFDAQLIMAFVGTNDRLYVTHCHETHFDQLNDPRHLQSPPESSGWGPAIASTELGLDGWSYLVIFSASAGAPRYLYEVGGGGNITGLAGRTGWTDSCSFEPAITYDGEWVYAWAGEDKAHRLNVATRDALVDRRVPDDDWYHESH